MQSLSQFEDSIFVKYHDGLTEQYVFMCSIRKGQNVLKVIKKEREMGFILGVPEM